MKTSFDDFADVWDQHVGEDGHFTHKKTILPAVRRLIGNMRGKAFYDIACGNGFFSRQLASAGAREIRASDTSEQLIQIARNRSQKDVTYSTRKAWDFRGIPKNHFDVVVAIEALPYVRNIDDMFSGISRSLKPGGSFIFSLRHPLADVASSAIGKKVDAVKTTEEYLRQHRKAITQRQWTNKNKQIMYEQYHRPFSYYVNRLGSNNLNIDAIIEPRTLTLHAQKPVFTPIPMFFVIRALNTRR